jgi:hypothetical protein
VISLHYRPEQSLNKSIPWMRINFGLQFYAVHEN